MEKVLYDSSSPCKILDWHKNVTTGLNFLHAIRIISSQLGLVENIGKKYCFLFNWNLSNNQDK